MSTLSGTVAVGVDGSPQSRTALAAALREAADRSARIRIVHVRPHEICDGDTPARRYSRLVLDDANAHAHDIAPSVRVERRGVTGDPAIALLSAAVGARLLVIGAYGSGRFAYSALGSTARALAAQVELPLQVVGHTSRRAHDRVVLGLNALQPDSAPVRYAFESARRAGARLSVIYYGPAPDSASSRAADDADLKQARKEQEAELHRYTSLWSARYPLTRFTVRSAAGMGENALLIASTRADLLVIGCARPRYARLGSSRVALNVLSHATCPVALVPYPDRPAQPGWGLPDRRCSV